jgi:hypothetical protein
MGIRLLVLVILNCAWLQCLAQDGVAFQVRNFTFFILNEFDLYSLWYIDFFTGDGKSRVGA